MTQKSKTERKKVSTRGACKVVPRKKQAKKQTRRFVVQVESCVPEMKITKRLLTDGLIGQGGMGMIREAFDTNLLRLVAKKSLRKDNEHDETENGRLVEEAQITAQLDHPNIVPVYELGSEGRGKLFFTMKVIKGKTMTEILSSKTLGERTARDLFDQLQIFLKVCDALAFAHSRGVIHQDLKPDNIMIGEFGEVYLMDWGFAKIKKGKSLKKETREVLQGRKRLKISEKKGFVGATLHYLAPEYLSDNPDNVDERTDIFGLGGILYKILTGEPPFHGDSMQEVAQKVLAGDVPPPEEVVGMDLPPRLSRIAMKALSRRPRDRYKSVTELKEDIERFLQCGWQFERLLFAPGEAIVREGEPGDAAYIITSGKCRVYRTVDDEELELGELGVGDVFGELAVFASRPRAATVKAIDDVSVMVLEQRHFEDDLGMSFWLGVVVKALAERFLAASAENAALSRQLQKENGR